MASYLIEQEETITRQEGDVADIEITVPDLLPMTAKQVHFQVFDPNGRRIIDKPVGSISIVGQVITIPLYPLDTLNHSGKNTWELKIYDQSGPVTCGKGMFQIVKTHPQ